MRQVAVSKRRLCHTKRDLVTYRVSVIRCDTRERLAATQRRRRGVGDDRRATTATRQTGPATTGPTLRAPPRTTADQRRCSGAIERPAILRFAMRSSRATCHWRASIARSFDTSRVRVRRPRAGRVDRTHQGRRSLRPGLRHRRSRRSPSRRSAARSCATSVITHGEYVRRGISRNARSSWCEPATRCSARRPARPSAAELAERVGASVEDVLEGLYAARARDGDPIERPADEHDDGPPQPRQLGVEDSGYDRVDDAVTAQRADDAAHRRSSGASCTSASIRTSRSRKSGGCSAAARCRSPGSSAARWTSSPRQQRALPVSTPGASDTHSRTPPRPSRRP